MKMKYYHRYVVTIYLEVFFMKKKILLSTFCLIILSLTSAFSMDTMDDSEKKQIAIKVIYSNNTYFDREKYNNVSFSLCIEREHEKKELGIFTFNVGTKIPGYDKIIQSMDTANYLELPEGLTLQGFINNGDRIPFGDTIITEQGTPIYHITERDTTWDSSEDESRCLCSSYRSTFSESTGLFNTTEERTIFYPFSLNDTKEWKVTLYPKGDNGLTHLYCPEGISYAMKDADNASIFNPAHLGLYSLLTVNVSVCQDPMSDDPSAQHYLTIGGL